MESLAMAPSTVGPDLTEAIGIFPASYSALKYGMILPKRGGGGARARQSGRKIYYRRHCLVRNGP